MKEHPLPTPDNDPLCLTLGIAIPEYSNTQLIAGAAHWKRLQEAGLTAGEFIRLTAVCEGSLNEATVLWDALKTHMSLKDGLKQYLERSGRYYTEKYGRYFLSERSCRRAFIELAEAALIVQWPQSRTGNGQKFRLDWVALSERIGALGAAILPGLD